MPSARPSPAERRLYGEIRLSVHHRGARPRQGGHLAAFRRRIDNDASTEFAEACAQVERIAELRLLERFGG
jgi:hypothetical protein